MKNQLKPIRDAMLAVLGDPRASRIERVECAKVLLSCYGCLIPDVNEQWLSVRQLTQLRMWKQRTVQKVLKTRERRKKANRKQYLKKRIRELETQGEQKQ